MDNKGIPQLGTEPRVTIIGSGHPTESQAFILEEAEEVGRLLAENGITIVCGGGSGVMQACCKGAKSANGHTIGVLPTHDISFARNNNYIDTPIMTGIGFARNAMMAANGQVAIAIGGSYGTLSEIAYGLSYDIPIVGLHTWHMTDFEGTQSPLYYVNTPKEAVEKAIALIKGEV